jgi:hypothetical protein
MATYATIDVIVNPLIKSVVNNLDVIAGAAQYWVLMYKDGPAVKPIVFGAYRSQRYALKREQFLIKNLQLAYVVFHSKSTGQWYWIKDGQLPPT